MSLIPSSKSLRSRITAEKPSLSPPLSLSLQFEIVSQHLVFANCIPLILKFFNQNIMSYISAKNRYAATFLSDEASGVSPAFVCLHNSICVLDFPNCVVHEMPELTAESLVSESRHRDDRPATGGRRGSFVAVGALLGSGRQQPVLLEKPVFLHQPAENIKQADQVETLEDHGEPQTPEEWVRGAAGGALTCTGLLRWHAFFFRCLWFLSPPLF